MKTDGARILVVIGTRPEAVKMAPVVASLRALDRVQVRVLATAQHREMLDQKLAFFGIRPDLDLDLMAPGQSIGDLAARLTAALPPVLRSEQPDLVLAQGDTTTVLMTALCCFHERIAFGHVEAGLRSGDVRDPWPEEQNRILTARLASIHFAPTSIARDNLLREGFAPGSVHVTGNTVVDAMLQVKDRVDLQPWAPPAGRRQLVVTVHRRENHGARLAAICGAVRELADRPDVHVVLPVHPNPAVRETILRLLGDHPHVQLTAPLDYPDMLALLQTSYLALTDSGGVQEEAPTFGLPCLVLRDATERPEGVYAGIARLVGADHGRIVSEAARLLDDSSAYEVMAKAVNPYGDGRAAHRIAQLCVEHVKARRA